jgi:hypothetical protein
MEVPDYLILSCALWVASTFYLLSKLKRTRHGHKHVTRDKHTV